MDKAGVVACLLNPKCHCQPKQRLTKQFPTSCTQAHLSLEGHASRQRLCTVCHGAQRHAIGKLVSHALVKCPCHMSCYMSMRPDLAKASDRRKHHKHTKQQVWADGRGGGGGKCGGAGWVKRALHTPNSTETASLSSDAQQKQNGRYSTMSRTHMNA